MEPTDQEIINYLLGDIDESVQHRMEDSLFSGDELFERLALIENRLIDLYVLDKLSDAERQAFEKKFLISERRKEAVVSSQHFINLVTSFPTRQEPRSSAGKWSWLRSFFGSHNTALQFALASLLLVVSIGFVWLLFERVQLNRRNAAAEAALRQKEDELRRLGTSSERISEERTALERQREELSRNQELLRLREQELQALEDRAAGSSTGRSPVTVFVLAATSRSSSQGSELIIKSGQKLVHLIADLKDDNAESYRASLKRVNGEEVWSATLPRPPLRRLTLVVPSTVFKDKDYEVIIEGLMPDGQRIIAARYALAVRRR